MEILFWLAVFAVVYAYGGYPLILTFFPRKPVAAKYDPDSDALPGLSIIIPAYNEEAVLEKKLHNTFSLSYPAGKLQVIVVSDGSNDNTDVIAKKFETIYSNMRFFRVDVRKGKANALNVGLENASNEIVVFSDSSIILEHAALRQIVANFADKNIGCISGEDFIQGVSGEGLYGKYELYLRNQESKIGSIVGASGSFYAQRKTLCKEFIEGLAPDFLSVLNTVEQGFRAITESKARGEMTAAKHAGDEYRRKVRTLLRGISTLWYKRKLMNPLNFHLFSFILVSHKLIRWLIPFCLILVLVTNLLLLHSSFYIFVLSTQIIFYIFALLSWIKFAGIQNKIYGKIPLYFFAANLAIFQAWFLFLRGIRQEIWDPTKRIL